MNLQLLVASITLLASVVFSNPTLKDLSADRYEVNQIMKVEWIPESGKSDPKTLLTIDIVNDHSEILSEPFLITDGISANLMSFTWTIPRYLKTSDSYHVRVYYKGQAGPEEEEESGYGKSILIVNPSPMRQSTLNLIEPTGSADGTNLESTCLIGEQCSVTWDYPEWLESAMPKTIDIKLYSGDRVILVIAQSIPVTSKSFTWQVPYDLNEGPVHVVISVSDRVIERYSPGHSLHLAASGYPFKLETRSERESRKSGKPESLDTSNTVQSAPISNTSNSTGVIESVNESVSESVLDVPRPTYAPKPNGTSSSAFDYSKHSISYSVIISTLILILMIQ